MAVTDLPNLQDALVRRFRVREQLPALDLIPAVLPVVQVDPISILLSGAGESPAYRRGEHAASSVLGIQVAGFELLTTGPQQAGVYDCRVLFSVNNGNAVTSTAQDFFLVRTLVAADIRLFTYADGFTTGIFVGEPLEFAVLLEEQEELRLTVGVVPTLAGFRGFSEIWLHRRS